MSVAQTVTKLCAAVLLPQPPHFWAALLHPANPLVFSSLIFLFSLPCSYCHTAWKFPCPFVPKHREESIPCSDGFSRSSGFSGSGHRAVGFQVIGIFQVRRDGDISGEDLFRLLWWDASAGCRLWMTAVLGISSLARHSPSLSRLPGSPHVGGHTEFSAPEATLSG